MGFLSTMQERESKNAPLTNPANSANSLPNPEPISSNSRISRPAAPESEHAAVRARLLELAKEHGHPPALVHALPASELIACADCSPLELGAYLLAIAGKERMRTGQTPLSWGEPAPRWCEGCGSVELWASCPPVVKACPWCWNRRAKRPTARPALTCELCQHFQPSPHNPTAGGGTCKVGHGGHNPMQTHRCADWRQETRND